MAAAIVAAVVVVIVVGVPGPGVVGAILAAVVVLGVVGARVVVTIVVADARAARIVRVLGLVAGAADSLDPPLAASATPTLKAITMAGIVRSFIRVDMEPS